MEIALDTINLELTPLTGVEQQARIYGTWRSQTDRLTLVPFEQTVTLATTKHQISLSFPGLLDATVYVESNGFTDKVYAGSGLWFAVGQGQSAGQALTLGNCRSTEGIDTTDLLLAGCADLPTTPTAAADSVGIGRTLNPNGVPVDVSPYQALRFWAKGNGVPVRIILETAGIADADYYQTVFVPSSEWQQYVIPVSHFQQHGFGKPTAYTGTDVKAILWLNADNSGLPLALALDQVSFTNTGLLAAQTLAESNGDTNARTVAFEVTEDVAVQATTLYYSLDDGQTYQTAALTTNRSANGKALVQGQLPAQPLGTDVRYYVEVEHANGYRSRLPIDAPQSYFRYQVDDRAMLLVDDFGGSRPANRLGGGTGLFNDSTNGGMLSVYQVAQQLQLDYTVAAQGQYAGYYTELQTLDARPYTTIDLLVRGAIGGEQLHLGLRDKNGYEPRLSIGDFLPGGLQTEWRWVQIPLASFGNVLDRAALESMSLTFYNGYVPTSGRIYVGEIRFTALSTPIVIDSFDDRDMQKNGQGLGYWTSAPNSTLSAVPVSGDATTEGGAALQLDYTVGASGYALWHSELGELSVADSASLSLWVRGAQQSVPASLYLTDATSRVRVSLRNM
ncbi:MAG: carbohydrate binding domain-containing protein [Caldilineaceae bacterium]